MFRAFRTLLPTLLRHKGMLAFALVMAFVSAANLGVGILGLVAIVRVVLEGSEDEVSPLIGQLRELDTRLGGAIPDGWIAAVPEDPFRSVLVMFIVLGVLTLIGAGANFAHAATSMTVSLRAVTDIRARAFDRLVRAPMGVAMAGHGADWLSRVVNDANALGRGFQALTNKAVAQITKGCAALVVAFLIEWRLALITLGVAPLLAFVIRKLAKRIRRASKAAMRGQGKLLGVATEAMSGVRVVKVHRTEALESARFSERNEQVYQQHLRARVARAISSPLTELIVFTAVGILALVGIKQILTGDLLVEQLVGVLGALGVAGQSLKPLNTVVQDLTVADAAAQRITELLDRPMEDPEAGTTLARHTASIAFEGVTFRYPRAERDALAGIDLEIRSGETVAFVGPNGSGKTTLLGLVPRLYEPTSGRVTIDGVDLAGVSLASLRDQIAVVTQETVLFRGTVLENIGYGLEGVSREALIRAAERATADEFVRALPDGYDTELGDGGMSLSGGQRQRLTIARAIARDPSILIMDEATSMIDAESEARITEAVRAMSAGRTCLVVAHRLSTVVHADRIVVMDEGRIADIGTHDELLGRCTLYQDLARHQLVSAGT
ncbi:MAG: ABC transporter ATP-binding protein [Phycisphaerales bacterium]